MRALATVALSLIAALIVAQDSQRYIELYREADGADKPEVAAAKFKEALAIYDKDGDIWMQYAQVLVRLKQWADAENAATMALKYGAFTNKFEAEMHYLIARSRVQRGDLPGGWESLELAMAKGYRSIANLRAQTDFAPLRTDPRWEAMTGTKDVAKMSRDEKWRYDLWFLDRETRRIHLNPYKRYTAAEHDAWVKNLHDNIPKLHDDQIRVALVQYMVRMGDGHTGLRLFGDADQPKLLPVQFFWFADGLHITSALPEVADLAGANILSVGGKSPDEFRPIMETICPADNSTAVFARAPGILANTHALHGLGITKSAAEVELEIIDAKGVRRTVVLKPTRALEPAPTKWIEASQGSSRPLPRYLKNREAPYWFEQLGELKAVYLQYNSVRADPKELPEAFAKRLFEFMDSKQIERLIVDVRWNGGGNSFLNRFLVNGIIGSKQLSKPDALFIITGRNTFSAAQNFTTDLGRAVQPLFVGEPTGSSPNFTGETVMVELPASKMRGSVSDLYWQRSWPMDHRTWIPPDLPALPRFELFKDNRDPAMEAIEAYLRKLDSNR